MTSATPDQPRPGAPTLCLGNGFVELVCERPVEDVAGAEAFVPRLGGHVATVSLIAAHLGAHVALAGGAGEDAWGRWLHDRLEGGGVDLSRFKLIPQAQTPLELVTAGGDGEPRYVRYGEKLSAVTDALGGRLQEAVRDSAALLISSDTLVDPEEGAVTMQARELALSLGRPVVFDPNLRRQRWRSRAEAAATANACVPGALLVCAGAGEAALMTGEDDPERAALALLKAGARLVVISFGSDGAILRGELRVDVDGAPGTEPNRIGAGEVLTGTLLARLATSAFYPAAVAASLPGAVAASLPGAVAGSLSPAATGPARTYEGQVGLE